MLDKLKLLLGDSFAGQDALLSFWLDAAIDFALSYCNLSELPQRMENLVVRMAADLARSSSGGTAKSLTEGSKSVTFASVADFDPSGLLGSYAAQLNAFRRLRWPQE